jgi:hypothetical protein
MTLSDLISELTDLRDNSNEDMEVYFSYDYGDHCHTKVTNEVSSIEINDVRYSDYHNMFKLVEDEDGDSENKKSVIILS